MTQLPSLMTYGVTGRLGRLLVPAWGDHVSCLARAPAPSSPIEKLDLEDQQGWSALPTTDAFLLLAGATALGEGDEASHAELAEKASDLCRSKGIRHLMLMSSAAVYGRMDPPLTESRVPRPESIYGAAKLQLETRARTLAGNDLSITVLRLGNVAGADALLGGMTAGSVSLDQFPDGRSPRRSYIGPKTLAHMLRVLARRPEVPFRILNLAEPGPVEMANLVRAAGAQVIPRAAPPQAIAEVSLDLTALIAALGEELPEADPQTMVREWRALEEQL